MTSTQETQIMELFQQGLTNSHLTSEQAERVLQRGELIRETVEQFMHDIAPPPLRATETKVVTAAVDKAGNPGKLISYIRQFPEELLSPKRRKGFYQKGL